MDICHHFLPNYC